MIQKSKTETEQNFKWYNCVGCRKHLAKIIQPNGLIEVKFSHGKNKQFRMLIHGSTDYTCPHCGAHNIIAFLKFNKFTPMNENGKRYINYKAQEAIKQ